jgi:hypothetical protein
LSLTDFLRRIAHCLSEADVPFMLTGSLAAAFYGTPRATQDIDLVIDPSRAQLDRLVELLAASGLYVSSEAAVEAFERGGQFNAIDAETGWKADLIVRKEREFSKGEFERRQPSELFGVELTLATVEDLIIAKLEWSELGDSELQRRDILQLLDATGSSLDKAYLERWVRRLGLDGAWAKVTQGRLR